MPDDNLLAVLMELQDEIEERIHLFHLLVDRIEKLPELATIRHPRRAPLSDEARKRIANAQKKRWAEHRRRAKEKPPSP